MISCGRLMGRLWLEGRPTCYVYGVVNELRRRCWFLVGQVIITGWARAVISLYFSTVIRDQNAESATCSSKVFTCVICGIQIVEGVDYAAEYVSALLNCIPCCGADFHALCRMIPYWYTWETKLRTKMSLKEKRMFKVWMLYKFSNYRHFFSVHMKLYFSYALSYSGTMVAV
jgi:hypothetical protein